MNRQVFVILLLFVVGIIAGSLIMYESRTIELGFSAPASQAMPEQSVESTQTNRPLPRTEMVQGASQGPVRIKTAVQVSVK